MNTAIIIDPEFAELIPEPFPEERLQLEANIIADGCREPLVVWQEENILLDGHNRLEICQREGIEYQVVYKSFPNRDAAIVWIIRQQFGRRNLSPMIRAELALRLEQTVAALAKQRQRDAGGDRVSTEAKALPQNSAEPVDTREELAKLAEVSHDTISKVKTIKASGDKEIIAAARAGTISINAAHKRVKAATSNSFTTEKIDGSKPKPGWTDIIAGIRKKVFEFADANPSIRPIIAQSLRQTACEVSDGDEAAADDDKPLVWKKQRARNARTRGREIVKHLQNTIPRLDDFQAEWLSGQLRPLLVSITRRCACGTKEEELLARFRTDVAVAVESIPEDLRVLFADALKQALATISDQLEINAKGGAA